MSQPWYAVARNMWANGFSARQIAKACDVGKSRVAIVCKDVERCAKPKPVKGEPNRFKTGHVFTPEQIAKRVETRMANALPKPPSTPKPAKIRVQPPDPAWWAEARRLRAQEKLTFQAIADRLGKSKGRVSEVCDGLVIDVDLRNKFKAGYIPSDAQMHALREGHRLAREMAALKPKSPPTPRAYVPRVKTAQEIARERIRHRLNSSNRPPAPITLPTLSILKDAAF